MVSISIHALREEGDKQWWTPQDEWDIFLSTPSARRATSVILFPLNKKEFLSTPSARRATSSSVFIMTIVSIFLSTPSARRATRKVR